MSMKRNRTTLGALASPLAINPRTGAASSLPANDVPPEERHLAETCGLDPAEAHRQELPEGGWRHIFGAFVLAVLAIAPRVWAAPGDLDPSFRGTRARTVIRGRPFVSAKAVVRQDDGKLVVAGTSWGRHPLRHPPVFTLVRYRPDGTRDRRFGSSGIVTTGRGKAIAEAAAVVQQADGKLVAAGYRDVGGPGHLQGAFALVRYDARGRLDTIFGAGTGTVTTAFGSEDARAYALVQQADGKLVAAGTSSSDDLLAFALVRYEPDGSVDPSFGTGTGTVLTPGGAAYDLAQQADGKLLAAGFRTGVFSNSFLVVRYDSNGQLDPGFGAGTGIVSTPLPGASGIISAILQQADGKIIAVGTASSGNQSRFAVVRYDTDGALDPTFGGGMGIVTTLVRGDAHATAAVQQPDGKIIVAGYSLADPILCLYVPVGCMTQFTLVRYEIDGTLDKSFGAQNSGTVTSPPGSAVGLLQQPDGRLVAAGSSFAVVRYLD
jgi:uncharacterized delta-60 repeat protein